MQKGVRPPLLLESLEVEIYELFMFEERERRSARKAAIQELVFLMHDKSPDDIRFTASILRQVYKREELIVSISILRYYELNLFIAVSTPSATIVSTALAALSIASSISGFSTLEKVPRT